MEEGRRVDDNHVVARTGDLEQTAELGLRHELGVLGPKRRRKDVEARLVRGGVAGELVGVELSRSVDEVEDRLLRLDSQHDRRVSELEVEIEEERPPSAAFGERRGEV